MNELPKRDNLYPSEVAKFLRISVRTVYAMIEEGKLPVRQIGRQYRIPREKFVEWWEKADKNGFEADFS